ncbi:MAG: heparinase II/III family protein [Candidatus Aminicenantes bacterium]|nr:MAG: heparinase II/III family protein [Candidatus Aminicenantes bacterium]
MKWIRSRAKSGSFLLIGLLAVLGNVSFVSPSPNQQEDRNLLRGAYSVEKLKNIILTAEEWHPFPKASEHDVWEKLPEGVRLAHIQQAEKHLDCEWTTPKASVFMEYVRTGNRSHYQSISFGRRAKLAELVLGECVEGKGRFLDDIMNGVWTICEETYWGVPAHVGAQKRGSGLPDVTEPTVDLFAAETAMLLAWTDYLLGEQLDPISPLIRERIHHEVQRRILSVNLERDDFWWMGFGGRVVNNWNPWICSNWLTAVLILEKDGMRRSQSIHKILRCLDNFLNTYPRDGGCDEGPGYWDRAGGSLYDCLELLQSASKGQIEIFDRPLIKEIGRYIGRAYISHPYFINFADAAARINASASLIFRYGKSIGDIDMMGFGAFLAKKQQLGESYIRGSFGALGRVLPMLFQLEELIEAESREPLVKDFWLPELQVMAARSSDGSNRGFYVAAKGGHNAESHNHNDVGNFIVYADGHPVIIDVGVETYTAKTFSDRRYDIWTMQSAFHNLPTINGVMQKNGREFKATDLKYGTTEKSAIFSLDISSAYPEEAKVRFWMRTITLNRGKNIIVRDKYRLGEATENLQMNLMCWRKPVLDQEGVIRLENPEEIHNLKPIVVRYDKRKFEANVETIPLQDARLRSSWGEQLFRIVLTAKRKLLGDEFAIKIER